MSSSVALVVHGHFYQPPRENPWSDELEREPSAAPFHDRNARIHAECYRANAYARIHDKAGRIELIANNYSRLSFNFGPTLARWIERYDPVTHRRIAAADGDQQKRLGAGGAIAQAYAHPILALAAPMDRRTHLLWGLADFRRRFGREAEGLWLPETAANSATLAALIDLGVRYTILAPEQVAAVRATGEEWTSVDRDTVDTGRAYRFMHPDGSGRFLSIAVFDGQLSRAVAFGETTHDAAAFVAAIRAAALRSKVATPPLVLCASDGELFGHHKKFADLNLAFTAFVEAPRVGIEPINLGAYLREHPATWEMALGEGPDGKGTAWSCAHGVGRWFRDCGCSMVPPESGWNHRWRGPLRAALDTLQVAAADFYEHAASELLIDPWGARDAYGEVVDDSIAARDELLATFATPALQTGGSAARDRARLLLEMQRATLMMYASCGFYFDDIAGLESSLIIRLAAYACDLMKEAGGTPPLAEVMDLLATAKSNQPGAGTGADVFRQMAGDRITPAHATATVALAVVAAPGAAPAVVAPGYEVEILGQSAEARDDRVEVTGRARATAVRTGAARLLEFAASWDPQRGFRCRIDGVAIAPEELGRESRHRLQPHLLPRLAERGDPVGAARLALALGRDVVGIGDTPDDLAICGVYARLLLRVLELDKPPSADAVEVALALLDAAGPTLAPGAPARSRAEERIAALIETAPGRAGVARLALRLGFSAGPPDVAMAVADKMPAPG
jgi:hypothetical protein